MESILSILAQRLSSKNGFKARRSSRVCFKFSASMGDGVKNEGSATATSEAGDCSFGGSGSGVASVGVSCGFAVFDVMVSASALICASMAGFARIWSSLALKSPVKTIHRPVF